MIHFFNDSLWYYDGWIAQYMSAGDFISAGDIAYRNGYRTPSWSSAYTYDKVCLYQRDYKNALDFILKRHDLFRQNGNRVTPNPYHGYTYLKNGRTGEAEWHFKGSIDECLMSLGKNQYHLSCRTFLNLARIYAGMGDKGKAMEYIRNAKNCKDWVISLYLIFELKNHPMFDPIRDEPEFQLFVSDMEARFEVERKKMEEVLREEGVLI